MEGNDFAIETTLATRTYIGLIKRAKERGFVVVLLFFWLPSADLAKRRVAHRVTEGGHNIPTDVIERRYKSGLKNLTGYLKQAERWYIFNNESAPSMLIAKGGFEMEVEISNLVIWEQLIN